jgi:hypothetical protein
LAELLRAIQIFSELGDSRWLIEAYNAVGNAFIAHFRLRKDGIAFLRKAAEVNDASKVGDYLRLAQLNASWGRALAIDGDLEGALSKSLEALGYAEKTDSVGKSRLCKSYHVLQCLGDVSQRKNIYKTMTVAQRNICGAQQRLFSLTNKWSESNNLRNNVFYSDLYVPGVEATRECYWKLKKVNTVASNKAGSSILFDFISKQLEGNIMA